MDAADFTAPCGPPPYAHSTFYQINLVQNEGDRLFLEVNQEQRRKVFVYLDCLPVLLGCFDGRRAQLPKLEARFQTLYIEVNHELEQMTLGPAAVIAPE
ncbi:MAG: hypothetical protein H6714_04000 [Myxococcales bacterium]|nr:hypothetical protein [Myxococcales bacterium]